MEQPDTQKTRVTAVRSFQSRGTGGIIFDPALCKDLLATINETASLICLIGEENLMIIGWNYRSIGYGMLGKDPRVVAISKRLD